MNADDFPLDEYNKLCGSAVTDISQRSLIEYLESVRIDGSRGAAAFGVVAEPWQRRSLWPIMRAVQAACGMDDAYDGPRCFWRDLPQGHDKTSGIARILNGAVAFSPRRIRVGCFAKDSGQAKRIWQFASDEARHNPWLADRLAYLSAPHHVIRNRVTGSEVEIHDADPDKNAGHKLDVTVFEEITWWPEKGKRLFDQLFSRRQKREKSVVVVLGNAGVQKTWQWAVKCEAERDAETWDYYRTEGSVAGWMSRTQLARDARSLSPSMAARLIDNRWITEDERAYLYRIFIQACVERSRALGLTPYTKAKPGVKYAGSIDAAETKDYAVVTIVGKYPDETLRVAAMDVFDKRLFSDSRIKLASIEKAAVLRHQQFNASWIIDPHQMLWFIQKYEGGWPITRMVYRGGQTNMAMAEQVKTLVNDCRLLWPEEIGMIQAVDASGDYVPYPIAEEFADLIVRDMPTYGWRWDHKAQKHDDRVMTMGMAAYHLLTVDPSGPFAEPAEIPKLWQDEPSVDSILRPKENFTLWGPDGQR
jgi:hypothetical protein